MRVPLVDLARQHEEIETEILRGFADVIGQTAFIHGPDVEAFEDEFAKFCGVGHCVGVGNGTDALELALRALKVGPGDEVIVPANSFIASALAVIRAGAKPVLVDCDPDTFLIDVDAVETAMNSRVKAVMPVHLYGQMAPIDRLRTVVGDIFVIEDAAQSQGATRHGRKAGSLGLIAGTSFYPGKNIGAYGDAGAVLTDDAELALEVRKLGNWGSDQKYHHSSVGFNSRLDTIQAVILRAKLSRLAGWNDQRGVAAARYQELLADIGPVNSPVTLEGNGHVWHLYVVRVPHRDDVLASLQSDGVGAGVHYPIPMHLQGALRSLGYQSGDFPVAERLAGEIISLPIFPGITSDEQEYVASRLAAAFDSAN